MGLRVHKHSQSKSGLSKLSLCYSYKMYQDLGVSKVACCSEDAGKGMIWHREYTPSFFSKSGVLLPENTRREKDGARDEPYISQLESVEKVNVLEV